MTLRSRNEVVVGISILHFNYSLNRKRQRYSEVRAASQAKSVELTQCGGIRLCEY